MIKLKKIGIGFFVSLLLALSALGYKYYSELSSFYFDAPQYNHDLYLQEISAELNRKREARPIVRNPTKNLYFGDTHVHTAWSLDAYLSRVSVSPAQSYRFARGEIVEQFGDKNQLKRPFDFIAVADHSEGFVVLNYCLFNKQSKLYESDICKGLRAFDPSVFTTYMYESKARPPRYKHLLCEQMNVDEEKCFDDIEEVRKEAWALVNNHAEVFNEPGVLTTFPSYEYSPSAQSMMQHRNILYRNDAVPDVASSAFESHTVQDLHLWLDEKCTEPCQAITIGHNSNLSYGFAFSDFDIDGDLFGESSYKLKQRYDRMFEVVQFKGASECNGLFWSNDEECHFEAPPHEHVYTPGEASCEHLQADKESPEFDNCFYKQGYVREAYRKGLHLHDEHTFNPYNFGLLGSSDDHSGLANPDREEGGIGTGIFASTPDFRMGHSIKARLFHFILNLRGVVVKFYGGRGIAAVWAESNTRDDIWQAFYRKEAYATTGTRIALRFFAGFDIPDDIVTSDKAIELAYKIATPMGGDVLPMPLNEKPLRFWIKANKDEIHAGLDKVQVVKIWLDKSGESHEKVIDIYCAGSGKLTASDQACEKSSPRVDVNTCEIPLVQGEEEINLTWRDSAFNPEEKSLYYVKVYQVSTCTHRAYDLIKLGINPASYEDASLTMQERAYSSPIWYTPNK
jgi:hypothetical protein